MNYETAFLTTILLVILWKIFKFNKDKEKVDKSREIPSIKKGDTEEETQSKSDPLKEKRARLTLWFELSAVALGWLIFIVSIESLHPRLWTMWHGNGDLGLPVFWISQALFVMLLVVFHKIKPVFYILITIAVMISLWYGFSGKSGENGTPTGNKQVVISTIQKRWRMCWEETNITKRHYGKVRAPCSKNSKNTILLVSIKEFNSVRFVFSVSWKEKGVFKERSVFYWDKITNPEYGTWSRNGSSTKDTGSWALRKINNNLFIGWITSNSDKQMHPMELLAIQ